MADLHIKTPDKSKIRYCLICTSVKNLRRIDTNVGEKHGIRWLMTKYLEINVTKGNICRTCYEKLKRIDNLIKELREKCSQTSYKRSHSPDRNENTKTCKLSPTQIAAEPHCVEKNRELGYIKISPQSMLDPKQGTPIPHGYENKKRVFRFTCDNEKQVHIKVAPQNNLNPTLLASKAHSVENNKNPMYVILAPQNKLDLIQNASNTHVESNKKPAYVKIAPRIKLEPTQEAPKSHFVENSKELEHVQISPQNMLDPTQETPKPHCYKNRVARFTCGNKKQVHIEIASKTDCEEINMNSVYSPDPNINTKHCKLDLPQVSPKPHCAGNKKRVARFSCGKEKQVNIEIAHKPHCVDLTENAPNPHYVESNKKPAYVNIAPRINLEPTQEALKSHCVENNKELEHVKISPQNMLVPTQEAPKPHCNKNKNRVASFTCDNGKQVHVEVASETDCEENDKNPVYSPDPNINTKHCELDLPQVSCTVNKRVARFAYDIDRQEYIEIAHKPHCVENNEKPVDNPTKVSVPTSDHIYASKVLPDSTSQKQNSQKQNSQKQNSHPGGFKFIRDKCQAIQNKNKQGIETLSFSEQQIIKNALTESYLSLAATILDNKHLKSIIILCIIMDIRREMTTMQRRRGKTCYILSNIAYDDLVTFKWDDMIDNLVTYVPTLMHICIGSMVPSNHLNNVNRLENAIPKLGMILAIMAQNFTPGLSRVQRLITGILADSVTEQKVYDRLQKIGVCVCYAQALKVQECIGLHFHEQLSFCIKNEQRFRLVGDNINGAFGVSEQRQDHKDKEQMQHAFGSIAIVQNISFRDLSNESPQCDWRDVAVEKFLLTESEWENTVSDYCILIARVAKERIPALNFLSCVDQPKVGTNNRELSKINKVIPLPIVYYAEVVDILDSYKEILHTAAGESDIPRVHIGGDHLTREYFSLAKKQRIGGSSDSEKLSHIGPISFELFHMFMNFLELLFKQLYLDKSHDSLGTMRCAQMKIKRTDINKDKEFVTSFVHTYIIEGLLEFYGMDNVDSIATKNIPPEGLASMDLMCWCEESLKKFVQYIIPEPKFISTSQDCQEDGQVLGQQEDHVRNYAQRVLELGLHFLNWQDLVRNPDRDRGMRLFKLIMPLFKEHNKSSKYAHEVMRFLVHQFCTLSEREAHEVFYGLFVNISGKESSFVPADERMDWYVGKMKKHVKNMFLNKRATINMTNRTRAMYGISEIIDNFDSTTNVIKRHQKPVLQLASADELSMLEDLRQVRPFKEVPGRSHTGFTQMKKSALHDLNKEDYNNWLNENVYKFATELEE